MELWTDALDPQGHFDPRYTCDFDNSSPELRWRDIPPGTAGFALVAEDPDAHGGTFAHWIVYNIPAELHHLPAGIPAQDTLPNGIRQGINGFGKLGYGGPCPPQHDQAHRYVFRLYALNSLPAIPNRSDRETVLASIQPHVIDTAEFIGLYQRELLRAG